MKHQFQDELRIKVQHDHDVDPKVVSEVVDKVVEGAVTIIAISTLSYFIRKIL